MMIEMFDRLYEPQRVDESFAMWLSKAKIVSIDTFFLIIRRYCNLPLGHKMISANFSFSQASIGWSILQKKNNYCAHQNVTLSNEIDQLTIKN